jgi:uncharacterized metal-binding protein
MAKYTHTLSCSDCTLLCCKSNDYEKYPPFCPTRQIEEKRLGSALEEYEKPLVRRLTLTSAILEADGYCRLTRVEETVEFVKRMGFRKVGVASCVGLMREAAIFCKILQQERIVYCTVGCKIGAVDKTFVGVPEDKKLNRGCGHESMCNPVMQAKELEARETDFNIVIGLCVGHDSLFLKYSAAPTTVMIVKDRVMAHNPVAALYSFGGMYSRFKK